MSGESALPWPTAAPDSISSIAVRLSHSASRADQSILAVQGSSAAFIKQAWSDGTASRAASAEAGRLATRIVANDTRLRSGDSALAGYARAVREARADVTRLRDEWDEADRSYHSQLNRINGPEMRQQVPLEARQHLADEAARDRDLSQQNVLRRYERTMDALRTEGAAAARTLNSLADQTVPRSQTGSADAMRSALTADLDISAGAMKRGQAAADAVVAKDLVVKAAQGDRAALAELQKNYADKAKDPYFAQALQQQLGPRGTNQVIYDMLHGQVVGSVEDRAGNDALLKFLGTSFATAADSGRDGAFDVVSRQLHQQWRAAWFEELKADGRSTFKPGTFSPSFSGYYAQGLLLSSSEVTAGAAYMDVVGGDFLAYDREGVVNETARTYIHGFGSSGSGEITTPGTIGGYSLRLAADPVNGFLSSAALGHDAAKAFLSNDVPGSTGSVMGIDYLMKERWNLQHPDLALANATYSGFADNGDALGRAALAADHDASDRQSTLLASKFVNNYAQGLADNPAGQAGMFSGHPGVSAYGSALSGLRDSVGSVMAYHIEDIHRSINSLSDPEISHPTDQVAASGRGFSMVLAKPSLLEGALADLALDRPEDLARRESWSTNPPALARLIGAETVYTKLQLADLAASPGDYPGKAAAVAQQSGAALGYITGSAAVGLHSAGVGTDQLNGFMRDLVGMGAGNVSVSDLAGTLGIKALPGGGLATSMLAKGFDTAVEAFGTTLFPDGAEGAARGQAASIEDSSRALLTQQVQSSALELQPWRSGAPGSDPATWMSHNGYAGRPDAQFWREDGSMIPLKDMSVTQRTAFTTWVQSPTGGAPYITMPQQEALQSFTAQYEPLDRKTR